MFALEQRKATNDSGEPGFGVRLRFSRGILEQMLRIRITNSPCGCLPALLLPLLLLLMPVVRLSRECPFPSNSTMPFSLDDPANGIAGRKMIDSGSDASSGDAETSCTIGCWMGP